jgi:hypothetical protein
MMRNIMVASLAALTLACAHRDAGKNQTISKIRSSSVGSRVSLQRPQSPDSSLYIGYVDYFPDTREFYTALFFQEGHEYPDEELLESKLDSVIVYEEDWGRERLPMEEAEKFLVLSNLDTLYIFNREHTLVATATFKRVEYLWNGLENYFIAVFTSDGKLEAQTEELYGISAGYAGFELTAFSAKEIEDRRLNENLVEKLHINPALHCDMRHFKLTAKEDTYSVISAYASHSNEGESLLTFLGKDEVKILNREINNFHFLNILPLPIEVNEKPLLLISAGYPSSDVLWDYLAGYNGVSYEPIDYNRIPYRSLHHR